MKLFQFNQYKILGAVATLALLLAAGNTSAGKPDGTGSNSPKDGGGASIGVSNLCEVVVDTNGTADLLVHTTITDKSSGETVPKFIKVEIQPQQKVKRKVYNLGPLLLIDDKDSSDGAVKPGLIKNLNVPGAAENDLRAYDEFTTLIDLCATGDPALKTEATAVNANVRVEVYNSNNTYTNSKCTAMIDGGLKIGGLGLCP